MCRAVEMKKASPAMFDDKEAASCLKRQRRNGKEVEGGDHFAMVVQERPPALGSAFVQLVLELFQVARDCGSRKF
jgi:hypothetical protein